VAALSTDLDRDLLLLTTPNDTKDAPWMVMADLQVRGVDVLKSILRYHVERHHLPWYLASYLKVTMRRGRSNRRLNVAPDLLMVEAPDRLRTSWNVEREGKPPQFVVEMSSEKSWERDSEDKPAIYDAMGVREYAIFAPERRDGGPLLFGYRRDTAGNFGSWQPDGDGCLVSRELGGLRLYVEAGRWLRALDEQGQRLPTEGEEAARLWEELRRLQGEQR